MHSVPATLPFDEVLARLNDIQPLSLIAYGSTLARRAAAKADGRLRISPFAVRSTREPFPPELRAEVERAFGVPAGNTFGSTEGLVGMAAPGQDAIRFAEDTWGGVEVHPFVVRGVLVKHPAATEYQVRQTPDGTELAVATADGAPAALRALAAELRDALVAGGHAAAQVAVHHVEQIERDPTTGKPRRFVPLPRSHRHGGPPWQCINRD